MWTDKVYNFLFHPMEQPTTEKKIASVVTVIALSVLSLGTFVVAFSVVYLYDRNAVKKKSSASSKIFQNVYPEQRKPDNQTSKTVSVDHSLKAPLMTDKILKLKKSHSEQLKKFKEWDANKQWGKFAKAHYDWWMFPINRSSAGHGDTYKMSLQEIEVLKSDPDFMKNYRLGVKLVLKSWGWDSDLDNKVSCPADDQRWVGYGVRLGKMGDSLKLFGEMDLFRTTKNFYTTVCIGYRAPEPWIRNIFEN